MRRRAILLIALAALVAAPGCTKRFNIREPATSSVKYENPPGESKTLSVVDERGGEGLKTSVGTLVAVLDGLEEDPMGFLARHIERELQARGIDLDPAGTETPDLNLRVTTFQIRNHRASGYSPYYTFTKLGGLLESGAETHRVTAYFKNGKVPVWAFREVEEPTYNIPISLVVKEVATKINRIVFGVQASSDEVHRIVATIRADTSELAYKRVFELGYTNNPEAIPYLRDLANDHDASLARAAAISSIGMLRATDQFDFLADLYKQRTKIEKGMALKSIGDLETPEAEAFMRDVAQSDDVRDPMIADVVSLYR